MKKVVALLVAVIAFSVGTFAQEKELDLKKQEPMQKDSMKESTWQGYLLDAKTAKDITKDAETAMKKASEYTKATALKQVGSGFGIYADGKWLKFDESGNKQALDLIKNTKLEKGIMVTVSGRLDGDKIAVTSIRENIAEKTPQLN